MSVGASGNFEQIKKLNRKSQDIPGAIVVGGDYQGLGIVRSLGRRGVPVIVVDDERSVSRHSRYAAGTVKGPDRRTDEDVVEALLALTSERNVGGWVVYPTREETVA